MRTEVEKAQQQAKGAREGEDLRECYAEALRSMLSSVEGKLSAIK